MKKLISLLSIFTIIFGSVPTFADQVWGDAVEVIGSNHDQYIELSINEGDTWSTPLNVFIVDSGKAVTFPVSGNIVHDEGLELSKTSWVVNDYTTPDIVQVSKTESTAGSFSYAVTFEATTDLEELSKSFDKVMIRVNVNPTVVNEDTTAPVIQAPEDIQLEATAILTPVNLGEAVVDDPEAIISNNSLGEFPIGLTVVNWQAVDPSGNIGQDDQNVTIVDTTPPVFTNAPTDLSVIYNGNPTIVDLGSVAATDIFPVEISNNAPSGGFPLGTTTVEWKATDSNGNSTLAYQNITVSYKFGGFLQPINNDGSSIFKLGSSVPVKFRLYDANDNYVSDAVAKIYISKITDTVLGSVTEPVSTSASTTGNLFRYDSSDNLYIFNLSTKPLTKGSYSIIVQLNDGMEYSVTISLR